MNLRTRLAIPAALASVLLIGVVGGVYQAAKTIGRNLPGPVATAAAGGGVKLARASAGSFDRSVTVAGRIGPPAGSGAALAFFAPGILASIDVRVGQTVRAGEVVARVDRTTLASALAQARADAVVATAGYGAGAVPAAAERGADAKLRVASERLRTLSHGGPAASSDRIAAQSTARQANLKVQTDRATVDRDAVLFDGGVLAAKDVESARAQLAADVADARAADARVAQAEAAFAAALASARADVAAARSDVAVAHSQQGVLGGQASAAFARLDAARAAYAAGLLRAPANGTVLALLKHVGEAVDASTPVVQIGPADTHVATLSVPADTAAQIAVGDRVTLDLSQRDAARARGRVLAVVPAVDATTQSSTVVVSGVPAGAAPGDAITARIAIGRIDGILVPASAIVQDPETGATVVFVPASHPKPSAAPYVMRVVDVRASDETTAVIEHGIVAGERVAAQGGYTLLAPAGG